MDKTTDERMRRNDESIAKEEYQVDCNLIYQSLLFKGVALGQREREDFLKNALVNTEREGINRAEKTSFLAFSK